MTLEDIRISHSEFCKERGWGKSHTPRNILLAMVGEVGELSEIFQWKGEVNLEIFKIKMCFMNLISGWERIT